MRHLTVTSTVDASEADRLLAPRRDVVAERRATADADADAGAGADTDANIGAGIDPTAGDGERPAPPRVVRFELDDGPFAHYERRVTVGPAAPGDGDDDSDGDRPVTVTQEFAYRLPPGTWPFLLNRPFGLALRRPRPDGRLPWWYPPQRPDARSATVLGLLATLSLIVGYHGTLLTQTMTFAADEFGASTAAQGDAFAAVRVGGVIAVGLGAVADRRGRRLILSLALLGCILSTALGALAPNLVMLTVTQSLNRGAWAAATVVLAIIAAEEMPAGARAYALSLLAVTGALGAGMALVLLPIADTGEQAWRVLYLFPLVFLPVLSRFGRLIPESRRYVAPHRNVALQGHYGRLLLVTGTAFLLNVFVAPQSQFRNEFLRDDRGMSATVISIFVVVTSVPAVIGLFAGGRLADTRGRRVVGATGIAVGTVLLALSFSLAGVGMWVTALLGGIFSAALVPTITVYGPELFPTSLRGRANGIVSMTAMGGSVVGLTAAGRLQDTFDSFGGALAVLAVAPLVMAAIVLVWFPETARRELEDLNPEDQRGGKGGTGTAEVRPPPVPADGGDAEDGGDADDAPPGSRRSGAGGPDAGPEGSQPVASG